MVSLEPKSFLKSRSQPENTDSKENNDKKSNPELLKLEPISAKNDFPTTSSLNDILKSPSDSVKARLSIGSSKDLDEMNAEMEKLNLVTNHDEDVDLHKSIYTVSSQSLKSRPGSTKRLQKIENKLKAEEQELMNAEEILGDYYNKVVSTVQTCNDTVAFHKESLEKSKLDTEKLVKTLEETDKISSKLRKASYISENSEMVTAILKEEYLFQNRKDKNGNITNRDEKVTMEDKRKLLETLKAIDNGENVEIPIADKTSKKGKLIEELFGDIDN